MASIHRSKIWQIKDLQPTDQDLALDRRRFMALLAAAGCSLAGTRLLSAQPDTDKAKLYPARRNKAYSLDRKITKREAVMKYINYYEFDAANKELAVILSQGLTISPWSVRVHGQVRRPKSFSFEDLEKKFPLEERLYRHRCVETWAMALPWTGFPLHKLLKAVEPLSKAKFVRFVSFNRPKEAPGVRPHSRYPWPYHEGLRIDEAMNELTLLTTGMYGERLPKQNGAPIRLVVPWKYGYKSIKGIVEIEVLEKQPPTFWNTVNAKEYDFLSNVNPAVPHPRWSQAQEYMIDGKRNERRDTLLYNGYAEAVAGLYK